MNLMLAFAGNLESTVARAAHPGHCFSAAR
jgi:hypothetical protein